MIRVFPRRTKWTPTDDLAFVGDPPLFRPAEQPVFISCTFTWDIEEAERLKRSWGRFYSDVQVGGPAYNDSGGEFIAGQFVKRGITITSRGCPKECRWCLVPKREGQIRELKIQSGSNVNDNNLLACSQNHIQQVFHMLRQQGKPITFSGGLDAEFFQDWHADLLRSIRLKEAWFSCDYPGAIKNLEKVANLLPDFNNRKKRVYVLVGFNGEGIAQAEKRLLMVYQMGFDPFAMLYRSPFELKPKHYSREWRLLQRKWCRPGAYRQRQNHASSEGGEGRE